MIEKILGEHEKLPAFSGVHGTTGYEWLNAITQVLIDGEGLEPLDEVWRQISNQPPRLEPVLKEAKRRVLETLLTSEFTVLRRLLARIAGGHYSTRDYSADSLRQALELYILHFPVYRTYLTAAGPTAHDRALISETIERARADWFAADDGIFDFLRDTLTMDLIKPGRTAHSAPRVRRFALKVQQFTGPVMAKSLEDTTFYRYHRLLALNEVGGDPAANALSVDAFHDAMKLRARALAARHDRDRDPRHQARRGRARTIDRAGRNSRRMDQRGGAMENPQRAASGHRRRDAGAVRDVGIHAVSGAARRMAARASATILCRADAGLCVEGRARGQAGNQLAQSQRRPMRAGLRTFIERILDPAVSAEFLASLETLAQRLALLGALNSLSQVTLKATMPGVPDFYQGTEFWDLSLVDPDNRRPVDFAGRAHGAGIDGNARLASTSRSDWPNGHLKLAWTRHLLKLRTELADVFTEGDYEPLEVSGRTATMSSPLRGAGAATPRSWRSRNRSPHSRKRTGLAARGEL